MSEPLPVNENGLTDEQEQVIRGVYRYSDKYELTDEDIALAAEIFNTPEKFLLLRKMLGVHTPNEAGMLFKTPHKLMEASVTELQAYGLESAISNLADERIRIALIGMYNRVRHYIQENMSATFKADNEKTDAERKLSEEFAEQSEEDKQIVGPNL